MSDNHDGKKVSFNNKDYRTDKEGDRRKLEKVLLGYRESKGKKKYTELPIIEANKALNSLFNYYCGTKATKDQEIKWLKFLNEFNEQVVVPLSLENAQITRDLNYNIGLQIEAINKSISSSNISTNSSNIDLDSSCIDLMSAGAELTTIPTTKIEVLPAFNKEYILENIREQYRDEVSKKLEDNKDNNVKTMFSSYRNFYYEVFPRVIGELVAYGKVSENTYKLIAKNFELVNGVFGNANQTTDKRELTLLQELQIASTYYTNEYCRIFCKNLKKDCEEKNDYNSFKNNYNFTKGIRIFGEKAGVAATRSTNRNQNKTVTPSSSNVANDGKNGKFPTVVSRACLERRNREVISVDDALSIAPISYLPGLEVDSYTDNIELTRPIANNKFIANFVMRDNELVTSIIGGLSNFIEHRGNCDIARLRIFSNKLKDNFDINIRDLGEARADFVIEYMEENKQGGQEQFELVDKLIGLSQLAKKINNDKFEDISMVEDKYEQKYSSLFEH